MRGRLAGRINTYVSIVVIAATFLWAAVSVFVREGAPAPEGTIELRISHWQLEAGVREAFDVMAKEYQALHPNVRVYQEAIPDSVYGQWMTTQLIGGTAPDIMQIGQGGAPRPVLTSYMSRYFVPLTFHVNQPNPYNAGTDLENRPIRDTFSDNMQAGYWIELQEYMLMPLASFGVRIFYNKDLYTRLTGRVDPPADYRDFLAVCKEIKTHLDPSGRPYVPIASSKWHMWHWEDMMFDPMTFSAIHAADIGRDGWVMSDEFYVALKTGLVDWEHPALRLRYRMIREVSEQFQTGYTGLTRDEAVFLFAQQRAVFMTTGTWDALSLKEQARGQFEVGLMNFPAPAPDDPVYGELIEGPYFQLPLTGFLFGVTRMSKHADQALDFLTFLASRRGNERLNDIIGWLPSVEGAKMSEILREFKPNLEGMYPGAGMQQIAVGGESLIKYQQLYTLYQVGQISYEELARQYHAYYMKQGTRDWHELTKDWRRAMATDATLIAGIRAKAMQSTGDIAESNWIKYRSLVRDREILVETLHAIIGNWVDKGVAPWPGAPYAYRDAALDRVRARVREQVAVERGAVQETQTVN